ncbi:MAG: hypothetical protein KME03_11450 [Aphanocapsa lilacina HA4352-LM1]|nr:hypothetical protein [Aphanocapsa lilacina HA4352-LM1]
MPTQLACPADAGKRRRQQVRLWTLAAAHKGDPRSVEGRKLYSHTAKVNSVDLRTRSSATCPSTIPRTGQYSALSGCSCQGHPTRRDRP